jgi:cytoskeletal protein CcmA (bactofilin family)
MALWNQSTPEETSEKPVERPPVVPVAPVQSAPILPPKPTMVSVGRERDETIFGSGVTIEGKIEGDANVRIAGKFKGDIQIKGDLNIEKGAHLAAKIYAGNVTIGGELEGNVTSTGQVKLLESGQLIGDLKANTLTVAAGSRMRGHVEFGWSASEAAKFVNGRTHDDKKIEKNGNAG